MWDITYAIEAKGGGVEGLGVGDRGKKVGRGGWGGGEKEDAGEM